MEQKKMYTIASLLLTIIFLVACSAPPLPPTTNPQATDLQASGTATTASPATDLPATSESTGGMPVAGTGLCANAYYPVRQGATWTYKSAGGPAGEYSFTDTVTAAGEDGFTLSTQIGDLARTQEWTCTAEGLAAQQLGGAPAAMLNSQGIQLNLDVTNASGVTFPAAVSAGDQWQQTLDVTGSVQVAKEEGEATGNAQMNFTALGNESVTVPAGTFDAMKVQVATTLNVSVNYEGLSLPVTFTGSHTYWFAPGVGWVKATGTGTVLSTSFSETVELQSYNIP